MEYLIGGAVGSIVSYFIVLIGFKCMVESNSEKNLPFKAFGKVYFFMTQDQIQKAVKAIILLEKSAQDKKDDDKFDYDGFEARLNQEIDKRHR